MIKGPLYVLIEGANLSGKTTLMRALGSAIMHGNDKEAPNAPHVHASPFPSKSPIGSLIRQALEGHISVDSKAMMYLFVADQVDQEALLDLRMGNGDIVITARHAGVSGAKVFQRLNHTTESIQHVFQSVTFREPDEVFIVDVPVEVALARKASRLFEDIYEKPDLEYLEKIRGWYLDAARDMGATVLDGTQPVPELVADMLTVIKRGQRASA